MASEMTAGARLRVFVIDDNAYVADLVSCLLRTDGFQVSTFYDALPDILTP